MKEILQIASKMLKDYASDLSNRGCNDVQDEITKLIEKIGIEKFNQMAGEWNGNDADDPMECAECYDWIVANTVANEIDKFIEKHDELLINPPF